MTKNWTNIHPDFNYQEREWETNHQAQWESKGFSYEQTKEWIDIGFLPTDYDFCEWLSEEGYTALAVLNNEDQAKLKNDYQTSFILKRSLWEWYNSGKLTFTQFSLLANKVPDKDAYYQWKEIKELLAKTPLPETNYRYTKIILYLLLPDQLFTTLTNNV